MKGADFPDLVVLPLTLTKSCILLSLHFDKLRYLRLKHSEDFELRFAKCRQLRALHLFGFTFFNEMG